MDTHSLIIKEHFLSYSPAAWELSRGRISAHVWIDSRATQILLLTIQKESLLSKPDILPFPSASAARFSPAKRETRRGSWASGEALGSRSGSATVRVFCFTVRTTWRGMSFPGVLRVRDTVMHDCSVKFASPNWLLHSRCERVCTDSSTAAGTHCSAELYLPALKTSHSCLFDTLFASVIPHTMWTWGARELCETSNMLLLKLCFSYHRNTVTTGTE